jgi:hypothetical protein
LRSNTERILESALRLFNVQGSMHVATNPIVAEAAGMALVSCASAD